jgi:hypothetical protein
MEDIEKLRAERLEKAKAKAARRLEWAEAREKRATTAYEKASGIISMIPFGQPILVGHHSEKRARRDRDRMNAAHGEVSREFQDGRASSTKGG